MGIINWMTTVLLLMTIFSFFQMANYLYRQNKIINRLAGIRIDRVYLEYIQNTIEEKGHVGLWLWINIISFPLFVITCFLSVFLL